MHMHVRALAAAERARSLWWVQYRPACAPRVHACMQPSNILVMGDDAPAGQAGRVRIADFGLARIFQAPPRPLHDNGVVVTIWYR